MFMTILNFIYLNEFFHKLDYCPFLGKVSPDSKGKCNLD